MVPILGVGWREEYFRNGLFPHIHHGCAPLPQLSLSAPWASREAGFSSAGIQAHFLTSL